MSFLEQSCAANSALTFLSYEGRCLCSYLASLNASSSSASSASPFAYRSAVSIAASLYLSEQNPTTRLAHHAENSLHSLDSPGSALQHHIASSIPFESTMNLYGIGSSSADDFPRLRRSLAHPCSHGRLALILFSVVVSIIQSPCVKFNLGVSVMQIQFLQTTPSRCLQGP